MLMRCEECGHHFPWYHQFAAPEDVGGHLVCLSCFSNSTGEDRVRWESKRPLERPQHLPVTTAQSEPLTPREHGDLIRSFLLPAVFGVFTGFAILATTLTEQLALRGAPTTAVAAGILAISFIGALQEIVRGGNGAAPALTIQNRAV